MEDTVFNMRDEVRFDTLRPVRNLERRSLTAVITIDR